MPPDPTQPITPPEPVQTPTEPQSALPTPENGSGQTVVAPEPAQAPTEPIPSGTGDSTAINMPSEAQNTPENASTNGSAEMPKTPISAPEAQNQPQTQISGPVEPPPAPAPAPQPAVVIQQANPRSFLAKALEKIQFRKRAKLEKIVKLATEKKSITNDQVEKLLHISDSTAERYLEQLVREGKLQKTGKTTTVRYELIAR